MPPSNTQGDVVVRLLSGESQQHELVFEAGRPVPPLALGTHGGWIIRARQVAKVHVMLAWSGHTLFVGTSRGEAALLDGFPLGARWTEVGAPSELRFGTARVSIGRRAGPDEETEVPSEEPAARAAGRVVAARPAAGRAWSDDQVTCMDDGRLEEALRLTRDDEVTRIAEVEVPPAAKRPSPPPLPPPSVTPPSVTPPSVTPPSVTRMQVLPARAPVVAPSASPTIEPAKANEDAGAVDTGAPMSSMPLTVPSDGLIPVPRRTLVRPPPVEVVRPSQPTMAIPEPHGAAPRTREQTAPRLPTRMDSLEAGALAVSGEHTFHASSSGATDVTVRRKKTGSALAAGWREASLPKRAIVLLMLPALVGALFMTRSAPAARAHAPVAAEKAAASAAVAVAVAVPVVPSAAASVAPSAPVAAPHESVDAPKPGAGAGASAVAAAPALRDVRTPERRALDAAASGQDASAAEQYEALATAHPETVAFREAARILRGRAAVRHD